MNPGPSDKETTPHERGSKVAAFVGILVVLIGAACMVEIALFNLNKPERMLHWLPIGAAAVAVIGWLFMLLIWRERLTGWGSDRRAAAVAEAIKDSNRRRPGQFTLQSLLRVVTFAAIVMGFVRLAPGLSVLLLVSVVPLASLVLMIQFKHPAAFLLGSISVMFLVFVVALAA